MRDRVRKSPLPGRRGTVLLIVLGPRDESGIVTAIGSGDGTPSENASSPFGPTTPKQFGAKHQTCPHLAVHVPPDSTLEMGAAEMGAAIRCPVVGDSPRGTETAEPLTSTPEPWSPPSSCF